MKLSGLIGLNNLKLRAEIAIKACQKTNIIFPHSLLYGLGGCGKTAFARAIGDELGYYFVETEAASFKRRNDLYEYLLTNIQKAQNHHSNLLLFVDEIHQLNLLLQESFYVPMKEWTVNGMKIPQFTLFGATTRIDKLDANSFLTRFDNQWEIKKYSELDIAQIIANEFRKYMIGFDRDSLFEIAKRCWGVPRTAVSYAKKIWMYVIAKGCCSVDLSSVFRVFELEEIDNCGLGSIHRKYLNILRMSVLNGQKKPSSMATIVGRMRQREDVIVGSVEPPLLELDFIASTSRGKIITEKGAKFLAKMV